MEDLSVTVRTYSASVASPNKATVVPAPVSKSNGTEPKVAITSGGSGSSLGIQDQGSRDISAAEVKEAVDNLNSQLKNSSHSIRFQIDDTTNKIKVYVVDEETGEVVRRIPPEASIRLVANGELSGLFTIQG